MEQRHPLHPLFRFGLAAFLALYVLSVLLHLDFYPLNGDEPRRAVIAIEMRNSGNYIMPTQLGWEYYNKPPVYNWLISAAMFLTGSESEYPVRLPSLVFLLLWGLCNYLILRKIIPSGVAALSSVFLVTSLDIYFWGLSNGGEIDIFYSFIVYLQVMSLFYFNQRRQYAALYLASYFFCAIGLLTKGFPSFLFQGLTLLALAVFNRSPRVIFRWQHLAGMAVLALIVGGYLYAYSFHSSPARLVFNLLKESVNKSAVGEYSERLLQKVAEYPANFLKILMPWSLLLLLLLKKKSYGFWKHPFVRFSLLFILFNIPVYWFTGHPRMRYSYMFMPFAMVILAFIYTEARTAFPTLLQKVYKLLFIPFLLIFGLVASLPLMVKVPWGWYVFTLAAMTVYLIYYNRISRFRSWYFAGGIILARFALAAVYLPGWYDSFQQKYDRYLYEMAASNDFGPVSIYARPDTLDLSIDLKIARIPYDTIPAIPFLAYQIPYYYYRASRHIVTFDTILQPRRSYIGFRSALHEPGLQILYGFSDKNHNGDSVLLFRTP